MERRKITNSLSHYDIFLLVLRLLYFRDFKFANLISSLQYNYPRFGLTNTFKAMTLPNILAL